MAVTGAAAFFSYAHDDDKLDNGGIVRLSHLLRDQYELISGGPLNLFFDRDSISWGDEWRRRIDGALRDTTFFIPVVTRRYFSRDECRRELFEFAGQAKSLSLGRLIMPILYVGVPNFSSENPDEAIAMVARFQYVDWRELRLADADAAPYRRAISGLAMRLQEIGAEVAEEQVDREGRWPPIGDEGIAEVLEKIDPLLKDWLEAVLADKVTIVQITATLNDYVKRLQRLRRSHAASSATLATHMRLGTEILPLSKRYLSQTQKYLTRSTEIDPHMATIGRQIKAHPQSMELLGSVRDAVYEAVESIQRVQENLVHINEPNTSAHPILDHLWEISHLSRTLGQSSEFMRQGWRNARTADQIVARWWEGVFGGDPIILIDDRVNESFVI
ncbi:toll/interleukin-1 receptor domain-containing protein [Cryptosporangium japonicum]